MSDFRVEARVKRVEPTRQPISGHISGGRFELPPEGVYFEGAHLEDVDFSKLKMEWFGASGTTFERCDFGRSVISGSLGVVPGSVYRDCAFDRADLRNADPNGGRFERCSFDHARLDRWRSWSAEFIDCHFTGRLHDVVFEGIERTLPVPPKWPERFKEAMAREPTPNEFRGNDFREADLGTVEFIGGIDLDAQVWPDDPDLVRLDIRPATIDAVERASVRLDPADRARIMDVLRWLRARYRGQDVMLWKRQPRGVVTRYADLLRDVTTDES